MDEKLHTRIRELLRHNVPSPDFSTQFHPVVLLIRDLLDRLDALEAEVLYDEETSVDPPEEEEEEETEEESDPIEGYEWVYAEEEL